MLILQLICVLAYALILTSEMELIIYALKTAPTSIMAIVPRVNVKIVQAPVQCAQVQFAVQFVNQMRQWRLTICVIANAVYLNHSIMVLCATQHVHQTPLSRTLVFTALLAQHSVIHVH